MLTRRATYMAELRAAIAEILIGRDTVTLQEIEANLPAEFAGRIPGRVTLSKAVVGLDWLRAPRPAAAGPAIYHRPRES